MSHASSLTDGVVENVSEHTGRGGFLGVLARSAGEVQSVALGVFFRVQHVGAMRQLADCIVPWRDITYHSLQKRKVICSIFLVSSTVLGSGVAMAGVFRGIVDVVGRCSCRFGAMGKVVAFQSVRDSQSR